jgi:hypothetical protein
LENFKSNNLFNITKNYDKLKIREFLISFEFELHLITHIVSHYMLRHHKIPSNQSKLHFKFITVIAFKYFIQTIQK